LIGGGCTAFLGGAASKVGDFQAEAAKAAKEAGGNIQMSEEAKKNLAQVGSSGQGLFISGVASLIGGLLSIIGGIMFFLNKGKMIIMIACGVSVIGEILSIALVTFAILYVIKILVFGFCIFASTKVGQES